MIRRAVDNWDLEILRRDSQDDWFCFTNFRWSRNRLLFCSIYRAIMIYLFVGDTFSDPVISSYRK